MDWLANGITHATWWQILIYTLVMTHVTMISVTIFLHRSQAHHALELHPIPAHFFRYWLWLTTGIVTKEWVGIHRKHHAKCETAEDPHSPQTRGIRTVLLQGSELYRAEAKNLKTLQIYGKNTPDDWVEKYLYTPHSALGFTIMFAIDVALFGVIGITVWAIQMAWTPIMAAGIINGIGHFLGYRNFDSPDASRNILPWGVLIAGEELHNNHHTYPTSAKLSVKSYEFDIGWMYIRILSILGLATVRRIAPQIKLGSYNPVVTADTLHTMINHRFELMARFQHACSQKKEALEQNPEFLQLIAMRDELRQLWERTNASVDQLVADLQLWCKRAEASHQKFLVDFSIYLRSIQPS
jgi:stearoyl-CoA desaturase (delta-9 desaturase)